ncbi:ABC transporter permease [Candidatus Poriferisocius sp.]|uniref:ABC transporter permease n=1 Tax=Candidatus Poriferisocius sp. TaxID=3101276 RepID=UPI003B5ADCFC
MGLFIIRRIGQGLVVVVAATIVVFLLTRAFTDPVDFILPLEATQEEREAREAELGFDRPLVVQFGDYVSDLARGDFGDSLWQPGRSTMDIVGQTLPKTLQLVAAGMFLAIALALPLGMIAALRPGSILDRLLVTLSLAGLSIPQFFVGLLLIIIFAVQFQWLPVGGYGGLKHIILPAIALALPALGRLTMVVRSAMIDELNSQYVRAAKAKGMPTRTVVAKHSLRNAGVQVLTLSGWEITRALAGFTVVVERVFAWPGFGFFALEAIQRRDLFLLSTIVLIAAVLVVAINVIVDILYKAIDPRIELS